MGLQEGACASLKHRRPGPLRGWCPRPGASSHPCPPPHLSPSSGFHFQSINTTATSRDPCRTLGVPRVNRKCSHCTDKDTKALKVRSFHSLHNYMWLVSGRPGHGMLTRALSLSSAPCCHHQIGLALPRQAPPAHSSCWESRIN